MEVKNLVKRFPSSKRDSKGKGFVVAVDGISFSVKEGEIVGLLGPNGAGKTSTIQMLLGVLSPTSGSISYFGKDFARNREEILGQVNFCSSYIRLPWSMTVFENMDVAARLYGVKNRKERIAKLLAIFEIEAFSNKSVASLSAGQLMRTVLAKSFINYPRVLLLDEPTASLDQDVADRVREFLEKERKDFNMSMLLTSHNMREVEKLCDRVIFLNKGKILEIGTPEKLAAKLQTAKVELWIEKNEQKASKLFKKLRLKVEKEGKYTRVEVKEKEVANFLVVLGQNGVDYREINIDRPDLEDFFLKAAREGKNV